MVVSSARANQIHRRTGEMPKFRSEHLNGSSLPTWWYRQLLYRVHRRTSEILGCQSGSLTGKTVLKWWYHRLSHVEVTVVPLRYQIPMRYRPFRSDDVSLLYTVLSYLQWQENASNVFFFWSRVMIL
jgi:hypothetical protein